MRTEIAIEQIIAACDGDVHGALEALLLVNEYLEAELHQLYGLFVQPTLEVRASSRSTNSRISVGRRDGAGWRGRANKRHHPPLLRSTCQWSRATSTTNVLAVLSRGLACRKPVPFWLRWTIVHCYGRGN
jgi:hypothetical protein